MTAAALGGAAQAPTPSGSVGDAQAAEPSPGTSTPVQAAPAASESGAMLSISMHRERRGHGVGLTSTAHPPPPPPKPTVLARTLAHAHRLQAMIDVGAAEHRANLAVELGFSRARITQIMDLLLLAPDIQEEILLSVAPSGRDAVTARDVRPIVQVAEWAEQRRLWAALRGLQERA
jgi:hypothetical protein